MRDVAIIALGGKISELRSFGLRDNFVRRRQEWPVICTFVNNERTPRRNTIIFAYLRKVDCDIAPVEIYRQ